MKYCQHCGKELMDAAVICVGCGSPAPQVGGAPVYAPQATAYAPANPRQLLSTLSQRVNTDGIIWIVIGALQILGGLGLWYLYEDLTWAFMLVVGVLNIVSATKDLQYSKTVLTDPRGIVAKYEPVGGAVITLIYNILIGGLIGVIGSIYYFVGVRGFVMANRDGFDQIGREMPLQ